MESIEPIIRLVKHQLTEILPVEIANAAPEQTDEASEASYLPLPAPKQVRNSFRAVEQAKFPAVNILPIRTRLTVPEEPLDLNYTEEVHAHEFAVLFTLADSARTSDDVENLLYKADRYASLIKQVVKNFDSTALLAAFAAAGLPAVPVEIVPGDVNWEEPADKTLALRSASIDFIAYA